MKTYYRLITKDGIVGPIKELDGARDRIFTAINSSLGSGVAGEDNARPVSQPIDRREYRYKAQHVLFDYEER